MYGPKWLCLLMYGFHDMRHRFFTGGQIVNGTPGTGASHVFLNRKKKSYHINY